MLMKEVLVEPINPCFFHFTRFPSSTDSLGRPRAEIDVLIGPRTAIVIGQIELCLWDLRRADGDCRDESTDDIVMSMTSRRC